MPSGCKRDCITKCDFDVDVDLDVHPRVHCRPISKRGTEFDIALEFEVNPRCIVKPKKTCKDETGCIRRCEFTVELDFDCNPKILCNPCGRPHAEYEVNVEVETATSCKPSKICKKNVDAAPSAPADDDFDCDNSSKKQCGRRW